ncbi:acyl-CoA dehydrogenase family protein [Bradyrhizobium diazoefficiens]|uniref:acyl-CoA dehydrogenase family protein n=1 Tax=Bradyrhizobium diazoefficiens TaxID=1355477 RepID=UPI00190A269F|nr:acyl-CoA dehydrogenase family protein [Bradyrhizobium diazoefficiens]MBK3666404.1 acyl-CoA dehydrogenase family protein [Bradyrhizobium diazoefficiens]
MDFRLTDEQRLLKDTLNRLIAEQYPFDRRRQYQSEKDGWSRAAWARLADLGILGVLLPERYGGAGGGPIEAMIIMSAFGRGLLLEPFFATVVLGGNLLTLGASEAQKVLLLPALASGKLLLGFAHTERHSRHDLANVATRARRDGLQWVLDGEKCVVLHGDVADKLLVSARSGGEDQYDEDGISLFLVDAEASGVSRRDYRTQDGLRAASVSLTDVHVSSDALIGTSDAAFPLIEEVAHHAIAAICAEMVGAMEEMQEQTVEYLKTRVQFGAPLSKFQVLQHRAVDMLMALEQARSMAMFATMMLGEKDLTERRRAMSAAKIQLGRSSRFVGQQAIQLHGGIGMTMDCKIGHYFKRTTMLDLQFGGADLHLQELAEMGGLISPGAPLPRMDRPIVGRSL